MRISDWSSDVCSSDLHLPFTPAVPASATASPRCVLVDERIGTLIPFRAGIVIAQHRGGLARLFGDAQREIGFDQPVQRLGHMACGVVFLRHLAVADDCRKILAGPLIETDRKSTRLNSSH